MGLNPKPPFGVEVIHGDWSGWPHHATLRVTILRPLPLCSVVLLLPFPRCWPALLMLLIMLLATPGPGCSPAVTVLHAARAPRL